MSSSKRKLVVTQQTEASEKFIRELLTENGIDEDCIEVEE